MQSTSRKLSGLAAVVVVVLLSAAGKANAALARWYVSPTGSDLNSCAAPIQPCATIAAAIGKASDDDWIEVAGEKAFGRAFWSPALPFGSSASSSHAAESWSASAEQRSALG